MATPSAASASPIGIVTYLAQSISTSPPAWTMAPMIVNTVMNPSDTTRLTAMARCTLAAGAGAGPTERAPAASIPRKYDRYAGSMANPHGFTVASMPVVKA